LDDDHFLPLAPEPFLVGFFLAAAETRPFALAGFAREEPVPALFLLARDGLALALALAEPFFAALMFDAFRAVPDVAFDDLAEAVEGFGRETFFAVFDLVSGFAFGPALALGFKLAAALGLVFDLVIDFAVA
jgi:hypothetical protein